MKLEYDIKLEENDAQIASALADKVRLILTAWGIAIQNYAVKLVPVGTPESTGIEGYTGGTLKQSITYEVDTAQKRVIVGSNVSYSVYVELGTGIYAENGDGRKTPWVWKDKNGKWHYTRGMAPRAFLRPSIEQHLDEYRKIAEDLLDSE